VYCAYCSEKILGEPVRQTGEYFCSVECANLASGVDPDEELSLSEHDALEEEFSEDDEFN